MWASMVVVVTQEDLKHKKRLIIKDSAGVLKNDSPHWTNNYIIIQLYGDTSIPGCCYLCTR